MRRSVLAATMILVSPGAQADQSRGLSLGRCDTAVQETKAAEPASAVDTVWAPMPRGAEAKTTMSIDTERPPGAGMSRRCRMKAAASHRRAPAPSKHQSAEQANLQVSQQGQGQ
jgi:hypothetical protein